MLGRSTGFLMVMAGCLAAGGASAYDLFHPTPDAQLRKFTTNRPSETESATTVDAGHLQVETGLVEYGYDRFKHDGENERTYETSVAPTELRLGLSDSVEASVIVEPYVHEHVKDRNAGETDRDGGFGDVTLRMKANLMGNDGNGPALAVLPFLRLPSNANDPDNDKVGGGVLLPFSDDLNKDWTVSAMTGFDINGGFDDDDYDAALINSAVMTRHFGETVDVYGEVFTLLPSDTEENTQVSLNTGLLYKVSDNSQVDIGVNVGVTEAAEDLRPFVGYSQRF